MDAQIRTDLIKMNKDAIDRTIMMLKEDKDRINLHSTPEELETAKATFAEHLESIQNRLEALTGLPFAADR